MPNACQPKICGFCGGYWDSNVYDAQLQRPICSCCIDRQLNPVYVPEDLLPNQSLVKRLSILEDRLNNLDEQFRNLGNREYELLNRILMLEQRLAKSFVRSGSWKGKFWVQRLCDER